MTKIKVTKVNSHIRFEAENHADTKEVCAGISALLCTLHGAIENCETAYPVYAQLDPGHTVIEYLAQNEVAEWIGYTILIGLMQIELAHKEEVTVTQNIFI